MNKIQSQDVMESEVVSAPVSMIDRVVQNGDTRENRNESLEVNAYVAETNNSLDPSEFRSVLQRIEEMGLTWTSDLPPDLVAKDGNANGGVASRSLEEIKNHYPMFPNELGYVIWYALTGTRPLMEMVGSEEDLNAKAAIVQEQVITPGYRDEFFFKHMVKVPSFANIDWEVIVKTSERGVQNFPGNAYALVSVLLENNFQYAEENKHFTFAINEQRLEKLIGLFSEMHVALQKARQIGDSLNELQENKI